MNLSTHPPGFVVKVVLILALGAFAMGNAKFPILSLVPTIAADLNSSNDAILTAVLAYFWGGLIGAPLIAVLCRNWPKHKILAMLSVWCFFGNLATSFATNTDMLYWLRLISGIPHAAFLAFAGLLVCEVVPAQKRGWYLGIMLIGLSVSTLIAVPFNTWLGINHGWQIAFRFVALSDILIALFIHDLLPHDADNKTKQSISEQLSALKNSQMWLLFGVGLCIITSMTMAWSFSLPWLFKTAKLPAYASTMVVVVLGMGFVFGQLAGGWAADRNANRYIGLNTVWALVAPVFLLLFLFDYRLAFLGVFLVSTSFSTINVMMQIRLLQFPVTSLYLVLCLFNACIQLGNFIGSVAGKAILHSSSPTTWVLSTTVVLALMAAWFWLLAMKHNSPMPAEPSHG